jgi:hypothetical protein
VSKVLKVSKSFKPICLSKSFIVFVFLLLFQLNFCRLEVLAGDNIVVSVKPESNFVMVGEVFTVNVNIANVPSDGLFALRFRLYYDNTTLEGVSISPNATAPMEPPDHFMIPGTHWPPGTWEKGGLYILAEGTGVWQEEGYASLALILTGVEPGHTGGGLLATIVFKAKSPGNSTLSISDLYLSSPYSGVYRNVEVFDSFVVVASLVVSPDLNSDGEVDIVDVAIVAKAYESYPEHPRWNPIADVNKDDIIDIIDIAIIARNFGKTV